MTNRTEEGIDKKVDNLLTYFKGTTIQYYPYVSGTLDTYRQRTKTFGTPVTLLGRAIHNPTEEQITVIGSGERYDVAFLFSRKEMLRKFPGVAEGEWMSVEGEMGWFNRRYKIEKVKSTGQVSTHFLIVVVLAATIEGHRDV
jgi:hypothetical protein